VSFVLGARRRLGIFGQGPFAVYWIGGFLSNVGTWLQAVAGSVFVYDRTGSAFAVGVLNFATFIPILLFSLPGGVISDRMDRRVIVVVTQVISGAFAVGLALLAFAGAATELHVIATAFALQTSWAIAKPALTAMLPALVTREELPQAVGLNTLQFMTGQLVGPVLATLVLANGGYAWAFAINAATFIAPIVAMVYLYRRRLGGSLETAAARASRARQSITAYVRSQPWIAFVLLAVVMTSAISEVVRTTAPVLVTERLGQPSSDAGLVIAAQGLGYVSGILVLTLLRSRDIARTIASFGLILQAVWLIVASAATAMAVAADGLVSVS
jgi:MFS family permease